MWEVIFDGEVIASYAEIHLAIMFIVEFDKECKLSRTIDPTDGIATAYERAMAGVTESVT